jgi:hypothetical protein
MTVLTAYGGKCVECGIDNPLVLDVHHMDRKEAKEQREREKKEQKELRTISEHRSFRKMNQQPPHQHQQAR